MEKGEEGEEGLRLGFGLARWVSRLSRYRKSLFEKQVGRWLSTPTFPLSRREAKPSQAKPSQPYEKSREKKKKMHT